MHIPYAFRRNLSCNRYEYTYVKKSWLITSNQYEYTYIKKSLGILKKCIYSRAHGILKSVVFCTCCSLYYLYRFPAHFPWESKHFWDLPVVLFATAVPNFLPVLNLLS